MSSSGGKKIIVPIHSPHLIKKSTMKIGKNIKKSIRNFLNSKSFSFSKKNKNIYLSKKKSYKKVNYLKKKNNYNNKKSNKKR